MKILTDTNILVAFLNEAHVHHSRTYAYIKNVRSARQKWFVSAHSIAETYAVLTRLTPEPVWATEKVAATITHLLSNECSVVTLSASDYANVLKHASELDVRGGTVFDALIARAAEKADVDRLVTFNVNHFKRVWPKGKDRIFAPL
ncbi:MAG TPA: PIN domain-containing protein [Planctomycetota bacterium]|nr:PIN domain-containing protein [Planctomycetota bacterium]